MLCLNLFIFEKQKKTVEIPSVRALTFLFSFLQLMRTLPPSSVDLVVTDPPYITRYSDRSGRSVANDDNARWLRPAFAQMHRLLKSAAFCISFYGWNKADLFRGRSTPASCRNRR